MSKLIKDLERIVDEDQQRLRDHFAGLAMQGIIASSTEMRAHGAEYDDNHHPVKNLAEESYKIADAMLKARKEVSNG